VHRDLKPQNVILERTTGRVVLVDFGLVARDPAEFGRLSIDDYSRLSLTGEILGTPGFMAPEQVDSRFGSVGPRTDVYALGGLLFFLLCGRAPYAGKSTLEVFTQLLDSERPPPDPRPLAPEAPADLIALCRRCLERDPARRPASAAAVLAELREQAPRAGGPSRASLALALAAAVCGVLALALVRHEVGSRAARVADALPSPPPEEPPEKPPGEPPEEPPPPEDLEADLEALLFQGEASFLARDYDGARSWFERALALAPQDPRALDGLLSVCTGLQDDEAILEFSARALAVDPQNCKALLLRGRVLRRRGDLEGARRDFDSALEHQPDDTIAANALFSRGQVNLAQGQSAAACVDFALAIDLGYSMLSAYLQLLHARALTQDFAAVEQTQEQALERFPMQRREILRYRTHLGRAYGDLPGARDILDGLLQADPQDWETLEDRIGLELVYGDPQRARELAGRFAARAGAPGPAADLLGRCALFANDPSSANAHFARALEHAPPGEPRELLWLRKAMALQLAGRPADAQGAAHNACLANPSSPWSPLWLAALGGDTQPLELLIADEDRPAWLRSLAACLQQESPEPGPVLEQCALAYERSVVFGVLGLQAERVRRKADALMLYSGCMHEGYTTSLPYEWAALRVRNQVR